MADPAILQVEQLLITLLETNGFTVYNERDEEDRITIEEAPCVVIEEMGADISNIEGTAGGAATHDGLFKLTSIDVLRDSKSKRKNGYITASDVNTLLMDNYNLSGNVVIITPQNYGGEREQGNDIGGVPVQYLVQFCTPHNDWNTLLPT